MFSSEILLLWLKYKNYYKCAWFMSQCKISIRRDIAIVDKSAEWHGKSALQSWIIGKLF